MARKRLISCLLVISGTTFDPLSRSKLFIKMSVSRETWMGRLYVNTNCDDKLTESKFSIIYTISMSKFTLISEFVFILKTIFFYFFIRPIFPRVFLSKAVGNFSLSFHCFWLTLYHVMQFPYTYLHVLWYWRQITGCVIKLSPDPEYRDAHATLGKQ